MSDQVAKEEIEDSVETVENVKKPRKRNKKNKRPANETHNDGIGQNKIDQLLAQVQRVSNGESSQIANQQDMLNTLQGLQNLKLDELIAKAPKQEDTMQKSFKFWNTQPVKKNCSTNSRLLI